MCIRDRPWVFSRDSDAATLTSTRASDARDYAMAERQALRQRGSIKAEDAARQRFERADAAFLWNQRVLAPVVIVRVEIMPRRWRGGPGSIRGEGVERRPRELMRRRDRQRGRVDGVERLEPPRDSV